MLELLMQHLGKGFLDMLIISMPIVLTAAGIGLVIGILQAVTQVQEQTISAAPKILGVFLVIVMFGSFFTKLLVEYFEDSADLAFFVVPKQGNFVLPANYDTSKNARLLYNPREYTEIKKPNIGQLMKNPGKVPYGDNRQKSVTLRTNGTPLARPNMLESKHIYGR